MTTTVRRLPRPRPAAILLAALAVAGATVVSSQLFGAGSGGSGGLPAGVEGGPGPAGVAGPALGQVETGVPADLERIDDQLAVWVAKTEADPADDISATTVGVLYLGRARITGDAADYERALVAADRAVAANPDATATRALKATLLAATHDFRAALAVADEILLDEPSNADALAVAGDAELELGRLDAAAARYALLASIAPGPALDVRLARHAWLTGDATRTMTLAQRARDVAIRDGSGDPAFYEAQLGEFARLTGDAQRARTAFAAALRVRATDQLALLGLARVDAAAGDLDAAVSGLRRAAAIAPRPETLALLGDVLVLRGAPGDQRAAEEAFATVRLTGALGGTATALFDRQLILFELDHGGDPLPLLERARAAAEIRPDAAGLDLVAWAAYRAGDLATAHAFSARASAAGALDARIRFHAGAIAHASGDKLEARDHLRTALELSPALDPAERAEAEALLA